MPLGRIAGVPVRLAPSWFVIALVVVVLFAPTVERSTALQAPATYVVAALYAVLLLVSVLVHEMAHALTARMLGLPVHEVVADLWGGHTQLIDESPTPGRSALVAVVGPLANAVLAGAGLFLLQGLTTGVSGLLALALVLSNAFVAAFNLAPGLPLDGGRVIEAAVWAASGRRWLGTLVAGWCGRVVALAVVFWGIGLPLLRGSAPGLVMVVWSVMIAALLWQGAGQAIVFGRLRRGAARLALARFTEPARPLPQTSIAWWQPGQPPEHVVAVDEQGRPVGLLGAPDAFRLLTSATAPAPGTQLQAVMTVLDPVVVLPAHATGEQVLHALTTSPARTYVVIDETGVVIGVSDGARLAEAVSAPP